MLSVSGRLCVKTDPETEGVFSAYAKTKTVKRLKLRVIKGGTTLTYDLKNDGTPEVFPLQLGDGRYEIALYENVSGNMYAKCGTVYLFIQMKDKTAPFLHANQYIDYSQCPELVMKAQELCEGRDEKSSYDAICRYMRTSFVYDYIKMVTVKAGVLPDINTAFAKHSGICQDLSAITVAMLRVCGIPSRLVIGYADRQYHAWTETLINGVWLRFDPSAEIRGIGRVKTYTAERYY